jgi:hypothetical protein
VDSDHIVARLLIEGKKLSLCNCYWHHAHLGRS